MKKSILISSFLIAFVGVINAQTCIDTVKYVPARTSSEVESNDYVHTVSSDDYFWQGFGQGYFFNGPGRVLGASCKIMLDFDAVDLSKSDATAKMHLYTLDANRYPDTLLSTATITIQDLGSKYQYFPFDSAVPISKNFAVCIEFETTGQADTAYIVTSTDGDANGRDLALTYWLGSWYNALGNLPLDADMFVLPVMEYDFAADLSTSPYVCYGDTFKFDYQQITLDSMFNQGVLNGSANTYSFDFGDGNKTNQQVYTHVYADTGVYSLIKTDTLLGWSNTCTDVFNMTVEMHDMQIVHGITDISCPGKSDGIITATASGSIGPYGYTWNDIFAIQKLSARPAGGYKLSVIDQTTGCIVIDSVEVMGPRIEGAITNASCNGGDGSATITAVGGVAPYTYNWTSGSTSQTISSLDAGSYLISVSDNGGCTFWDSVVISGPTALVIGWDITDATCNNSDGAATVSATSGGTSPYSYSWSTGSTTTSIASVFAGTYTITIMDSDGCEEPYDVVIKNSNGPSAVITVDASISCNGISDGAVTVVATGGTPGYTYSWSNGSTATSLTSLMGAMYTVTVTDNGSCSVIEDVDLTEPDAITLSTGSTDVNCNGDADGSAVVTVAGGSPSYTILWSNGSTSSVLTGLSGGTFAVTVTDANNCKDTVEVTVNEPASAVSAAITDNDILCNGASTGSASVTGSGGAGSYTYAWSTGATSSSISSLSAGNYTVTVMDVNACSKTTGTTVSQPTTVSIATGSSDITCNGKDDGTASVTGAGGTPGYTYSWSNGSTTQSVSNLSAGSLAVTVIDANDCSEASTVTISEPTALLIFTSSTDETENGLNDGAASASGDGGTQPYTYAWSNGSTGKSLSSLAPGTYGATVTDANGCMTSGSATVAIGPDGIETLNLDRLIKVYPNPSNGLFNIELDIQNQEVLVDIFNAVGENVISLTRSSGELQILDLSSLPKGIYIMNIKTNKGSINKTLSLN